ncbi:MAG: sulfite exporter TauE/SafE family protein [Acidobacteria bacterium]|nr:sulfite exporter TauE/SafE family protein [Acidobacteriota bacterium]
MTFGLELGLVALTGLLGAWGLSPRRAALLALRGARSAGVAGSPEPVLRFERLPTRTLVGVFLGARVFVHAGMGAVSGELGLNLLDAASPGPALANALSALFALAALPWVFARGAEASTDRLLSGGIEGAKRMMRDDSPWPPAVSRFVLALLLGGFDGFRPPALVIAFVALAFASGGVDLGAIYVFAASAATLPPLLASVYGKSSKGLERLGPPLGAALIAGLAVWRMATAFSRG